MKVVLFMEGGVIHDIISDGELEVRVVDADVEGLHESETQTVEGETKFVFTSNRTPEVDTKRVEQIFNEIAVNEKQNK
ncbi:hypothetical protein ACFSCX_06030 [Bacillus salitolerans]|uniref:DUF3006 domain-containing protein n=1 Tax=Bacillus salitolerans TaxID=1437434 RepID=A0ABW4LMY7_9BACI